MTRTISNSDDIIDSRDVIARIDDLESDRDSFPVTDEDGNPIEEPTDEQRALAWGDENPDDAAELRALVALADECEGYVSDWRHGEALIRDSYFEDYARQLAEDIGAIDRGVGWPARCIDWEQAASELQQDYTSVDFDGVTYWVRS